MLALFLKTRQWQRQERAERLEVMARQTGMIAATQGLKSEQIEALCGDVWTEIRELREPEAGSDTAELSPEMRRVLYPYEFMDADQP